MYEIFFLLHFVRMLFRSAMEGLQFLLEIIFPVRGMPRYLIGINLVWKPRIVASDAPLYVPLCVKITLLFSVLI